MFSKKDKTISLFDIDNPEGEKKVLDPWFGIVFQLADGQHTIQELFHFMTDQYSGNPPENLRDTIESVLKRLAESKLIMIVEKATELPYYLSAPFEFLDPVKAKDLYLLDKKDFRGEN